MFLAELKLLGQLIAKASLVQFFELALRSTDGRESFKTLLMDILLLDRLKLFNLLSYQGLDQVLHLTYTFERIHTPPYNFKKLHFASELEVTVLKMHVTCSMCQVNQLGYL